MRARAVIMVLMAALLAAPALAAAPAAAGAAPAAGAAERQVRSEAAAKAFMQGKYEDALATYLDLYVQSDGRPEYLRNIGRCQQKLKQYDRAIDTFKEYLRRAKKLSAEERREVQGFISEMQTALANEQSAARQQPAPTPAPTPAPPPPQATPEPAPVAAPPPPPVASAPPPPQPMQQYPAQQYPAPPPTQQWAPVGPPPSASPPVAREPPPAAMPPQMGGPPGLVERAPPPAPAPRSKLKTFGVVSLIAAAVLVLGGTLELASAKSSYEDGKNAGCRATGGPTCSDKADSVASANRLSQILYVAGGLVGAAGVVMIVVAPSSAASAEPRVSLGARFRF